MAGESKQGVRWRAKGLLFENCRCQLVCPGHVHFDQLCTHDPCLGHWALRVDEGEFDGASLVGLKAIVLFESPQRMIDGGWKQVIIIDEAASSVGRAAMESILDGSAGGPWEKLAQFVGERLTTKFLPIRIEDEETRKSIVIDGLLESSIEGIRGRDRSEPVRFENIFNQIHSPSQVLARGDTFYDDGDLIIAHEGTHGLWSTFDWSA